MALRVGLVAYIIGALIPLATINTLTGCTRIGIPPEQIRIQPKETTE